MLQALFHAWERRLASATTNRVVRPFDWGLDWIPANGSSNRPAASQLAEWVEHVMTDTDAFFTPPPTHDYALGPASADGERLLTFPSAFNTPHDDEQHRLRATVSATRAAVRQGPARSSARAPAMEFRCRRTRRAVEAARAARHDRAASQPSLSRSADAARARARRLHRERECRANGAGLSSGGARCASRHCLACGRRVRTHRHSWIEPRVMSVAADNGA